MPAAIRVGFFVQTKKYPSHPELVQFCLKNINSKISRRGVTLIIYAKVISRFAAVARRAGARYERLRGSVIITDILIIIFLMYLSLSQLR